MTRYNCIAVCAIFWCIYGSQIEISASDISHICTPNEGGDVKITISNIRKKPGHFYTQVNVDDGLDQIRGRKSCYQININQDTCCGLQTPNTNTKCFKEPPRPFYELIPGLGYYKLHTHSKSWHSAKLVCETEGAHLAIINSEEEVAILKEFRRRLPKLHGTHFDIIILLGFHDIGEDGVWKTISNQPLKETGFERWEAGEPVTNEDCGCINVDTGNLHSCICTDVLPFFCELEI